VPSKEDMIFIKIGLKRWNEASSGYEYTQAQQRSPTSEVAPGRIFALTNLAILFRDCQLQMKETRA